MWNELWAPFFQVNYKSFKRSKGVVNNKIEVKSLFNISIINFKKQYLTVYFFLLH